MRAQEFAAQVGPRLLRAWTNSRLEQPDVMTHYADVLQDLPMAHVIAAVTSYEAEGREFAPSAGALRKRVIEMQIDAPPWHGAWEWIRRLPHAGYLDRTYYDPRREGPAAKGAEWHCWRIFEEMPAPVRAFCRQLGRSQLVDNLFDQQNGEARLREKYAKFLSECVQTEVLAQVEGADDLPRVERAKREQATTMGELMGAVVKELGDGRAA